MVFQEFPEQDGLQHELQWLPPGSADSPSGVPLPETEVSPAQRLEQARQNLVEFWGSNREEIWLTIQEGYSISERMQGHAGIIGPVVNPTIRALGAIRGFYDGSHASASGDTLAHEGILTKALDVYTKSQHKSVLRGAIGGIQRFAEAAVGVQGFTTELFEAYVAKIATDARASEAVASGATSQQQEPDAFERTEASDQSPSQLEAEAAWAQSLSEYVDSYIPMINGLGMQATYILQHFAPADLVQLATAHQSQALDPQRVLTQLDITQRWIAHIGDQAQNSVQLAAAFQGVLPTLEAWVHSMDVNLGFASVEEEPEQQQQVQAEVSSSVPDLLL